MSSAPERSLDKKKKIRQFLSHSPFRRERVKSDFFSGIVVPQEEDKKIEDILNIFDESQISYDSNSFAFHPYGTLYDAGSLDYQMSSISATSSVVCTWYRFFWMFRLIRWIWWSCVTRYRKRVSVTRTRTIHVKTTLRNNLEDEELFMK